MKLYCGMLLMVGVIISCGKNLDSGSGSGSALNSASGVEVLGQGDYHASSAPGSLKDYVTRKAQEGAYRDARRKCAQLGYNGNPREVGAPSIATGIENGYYWATYDGRFLCQDLSTTLPTVNGSGVGQSIISVPNAQSLAYANALNEATNRCAMLQRYQSPRLIKTIDSHWSCQGSNCTAWFTGVFQCP